MLLRLEQRPVDAARQRASELHGQVAGMIEHLGQQLQALVVDLRTVGDPEAAELQIEAVTSQAAEQVATAAGQPLVCLFESSTELLVQRRGLLSSSVGLGALGLGAPLRLLGPAGTSRAAEDARARLIAELADVRAAVDTERQELAARLTDLQEKLTFAEARLVEVHGDRDAAVRRAEAAMVAQSEAEQRSRNAVERADAESTRARLAEERAESSRHDLAQADRQAADLRDQVGELRAQLAAITAQRDAAVHEAEREKAHGRPASSRRACPARGHESPATRGACRTTP